MATENLTPEEQEEYEQGMAEAMYCTACQAFLWQDCICEDEEIDSFQPKTYDEEDEEWKNRHDLEDDEDY